MGTFEYSAEELRDIILNKVLISKCPDCGCYSQFGKPGEIPDDGDGNILPVNLVQEHMDEHHNEDNDKECWWSICETCEGLGYLIKFIN